ncbi:MAG TPA: ABC transporter substrate-binding protein [Acidobacteriaceae bacterium]|nr:ABC transporter substrate-binding protein [Acidobacteriaceae bacterium]
MEKVAAILVMTLAGVLPRSAVSQSSSSSSSSVTAASTMPYADMPPAAVPYGRYRKPYKEWFVDSSTLDYNGAARERSDVNLAALKTVNIGFLGPLDADNPDSPYGISMLHGSQLVIEEANARGGYDGKPFALDVHDDLPLWGASSMAIVDMVYNDHDVAMLGSVDSASTHIELRATLKLELPIVDTATNDPTVTQTRVPWLLHNFPDDRQQGYALADYIFNQRHLKRVGILQVNNRYGRAGKDIFFETARRIGHQPIVEVWYAPDATDFSAQLKTIKSSAIDGLVIWGNASQAGQILKQMRAMGMRQPVFASSRAGYPEVMKIAGPAAEGLVMISAIDPNRSDPAWQQFRRRFTDRFHTEPDAYAAYAYDGMNMLIAAIQTAGLNRGKIMDALRQYEMKSYTGVSGKAFFDYTLNNIAPVTFARVQDGQFVYWPEQRTDWKGKPAPFWR